MDTLNFILANWQTLANIALGLVLLFQAVKGHYWDQVIRVAGQLAYEAATLAGLDKEDRRKYVAQNLYALAPLFARKVFTAEQFELAVEMGYKLIAKPRLQAEGKV